MDEGQNAVFIEKLILVNGTPKNQLALGKSLQTQEINREIRVIKNKIYAIQHYFQREEKNYSAIDLRHTYLGKDKPKRCFLKFFKIIMIKLKVSLKDFSAGTTERYRTCKKQVGDFIKTNYKKNDIAITGRQSYIQHGA